MAVMRKLLLVSLMMVLGSAPAFAGPYFSQLLEIKAYRAAYTKMLAGANHLPAWLVTFNKTGSAVETPSRDLQIGDDSYSVTTACKPHDCGGNMLVVMFDLTGDNAWGLLTEDDYDGKGKQTLLGKPDAAIADALRKQLAGD
jgi:hypothetical protein